MALIQANRESIDDRFSVLGFTVRTENPLFEVALAAHPDLLKGENRSKRTASNFFTSRVLGATRRGEAVYLVPPNVVARFVGQPRLYFGLATYREGDRSNPVSVKIPDTGSMYVNTAGLTERGLRRTARGNGAVAYGNGGGDGLGWGGDALAASSNGAAPAARNGNGASAAAPSGSEPAPYSDGYSDDLWKQDSAAATPAAANGAAPAASAPAPAPTNGNGGEPRLAASQAYGGRQVRQPYAKPFLVEPYDRPSSWWDALTTQIAHFARGAMWFLGVTDTTQPPYSAICQVRRPDGSAEGAHMGTAFFIGPRLLLTAAHVVDGQSELIIVPGKNGAGTGSTAEPFGRFRTTQFRKHDAYGTNGHDNDMALICVPAANAAAAPNYFGLVEELTQSRPEGVVVSGYAAWWHATSAIEEYVNANIDENRQHAHGGYIRDLTDGSFTYDLQTLAGTSGSPVYWIEDGGAPCAHLVGVHVAANDDRTNRGCRITQEKLGWIRRIAAEWGQTLTFSLGARALEDVAAPGHDEDPDSIGISEDEPVPAEATAQALRARGLDAPAPDYPAASRFVPAHARNFTRGRRTDRVVDRIVIHITAGGPSINGTIGWFQNGDRVNERTGKAIRSSSHYIVGRDGEVVQMVRNADTAHHASSANSRSIGIEHNANKPSRGNQRDLPPTEAQYEASARLVAWLCQQYGLPADREHIRGHFEISPRDNHDCPSSYWDWDYYMACVQRAVADLAASATPTAQGLGARPHMPAPQRRPAYARAHDSGETARFTWPAGMGEGNYLVKAYLDAYDSALSGDTDRADRDRQALLSLLTRDLQSDRDAISQAILMITTAVSIQVFDQIKDRLPPTMYYIGFDPADPTFTQDVQVPHALTVLSRRIGGFMAYLDLAIQRASADEAVRLSLQKEEWERLSGAIGLLTTAIGMVPGLGTAASIAVNLISTGVTQLVSALAPDFDRRHASFAEAMQAVRTSYKQLSATVLEALVKARLAPDMALAPIGNPLHPGVAAFLDAHAAYALLGWQEQLVALGVASPATSLGTLPRRFVVSRAQEIIVPYYDPSDPSTALTCTQDAFSQAREEWFVGVSDTRSFPHSAICQLNMTAPDGSQYGGTGFYIGRNRILTCAHNLHGMSSCEIIPGRNGAGDRPFGATTVTSSSWRVAPRYSGSGDWDNDLAVIDNVPIAAPGRRYFEFLNATPSTHLPVVVCGYSAASRAVPEIDYIIDGDKQHLHGGYVSSMPTFDTIDYPILSLMGASGSPVYTITGSGNNLQARICAVHVSGEPAAQGLNRGCFITPAKIDWIEGRATTFAYRARGLSLEDEDAAHGIEGPIPDDTATAQALARTARGLQAQAPEYPPANRFVAAHSGNYRTSTSARAIERVVIHITDGGANINGTIGWFQNPAAQVSAHYVIGQDGEIVQMVRHNDVAWHARSANRNSIGIEHVANTRGLNPTPAQMCASAALVTWLCDTYAIPADRTHILGHSEADTATTHTGCPNAVWNWDYYMGMVTSRTCYAPDAATAQAFTARSLGSDQPDYGVHLIPQPDKNSCWAAAMAMLYSFRRNLSLTPETLANDVGASLATSYGWDLLEAVRTRYGFEMIRQPDNTSLYHTPQQWADWLATYGPLWVVIVGAPHAVVVAGIKGNLADPASVRVKILNPWDTRVAFDNDAVAFNPRNNGYEDWLSFNQFAADFGNMAQPDYGNWRVLHLPVSAANAQSLGLGGRLRTRALDADAVAPPINDGEPIEPSRVAGTTMRVLRGSAGACQWALERLEGVKSPATPNPASTPATSGDVVIDLDDWPALEGAATPLPVRIVFHHTTAGAVGHIHIEAGTPANLAYGVDVTARIEDEADVGNVAALKVVVDYRFSGLAPGNPTARTELRLLGDGRYERVSRWVTTAQAA